MAEAPRPNEAEIASQEEIRKKLESRERKYSNLTDSRSRLLAERDQINSHSDSTSREAEEPWKATWDNPDVQNKDHRGWNASIESEDSVIRDEASAENRRYERIRRSLNRISKQLSRTQQELSQLYYQLESDRTPDSSEPAADDSEKIVPYTEQNNSVANIKDDASDKLAKAEDSDIDIELIPDKAKSEAITVAPETGEVSIEPSAYQENLDITLADIKPEDIIINIDKEDLEPSPDLPDYKKEALRFINELAKRDQERAIDRYGGFKPFASLSGALRLMSAAKIPFTKLRPFAGAEKLASTLEKANKSSTAKKIGRYIGKIRSYFDRVGQRTTLTEDQIANDTEIDQNLAQVGNFKKNQRWKRPLKTAAKVMGGFGVAGALVMTGGVGAATALLWASSMKEGYDGIAQTVEQVGWGRKRIKAELETQSLLSEPVDQLKSRVSSNEQMTAEEFARLTEEILQREQRLMATQEMNTYGEKQGQQIRSIATSALTIGTGLFAGVPMGKINYDTNNTSFANTARHAFNFPENQPIMEQSHRGFWNLLKGGQFGYEHNSVLNAVKDSYDGKAGGLEFDRLNSWVNMLNNFKNQPFGSFTLTPTSVYGQTSHVLGQGLALIDKLKIGAAGAYLLGETLRHYQGPKATASKEATKDSKTSGQPDTRTVLTEKPFDTQIHPTALESPTAKALTLDEVDGAGTPKEVVMQGEKFRKADSKMTEINNEESSQILDGLSLNNIEYNGGRLSADRIKELGLSPKHKVTINGKTSWVSENSFSFEGKTGGLVFMGEKGNYSVLPYLADASHDNYRLQTGFIVKKDANGQEIIDWNPNGLNLTAVQLPPEFQQAISRQSIPLTKPEAELVLVGSSKRLANMEEAAGRFKDFTRPEQPNKN